ncbi:Protein of unknown function [Streptomyces sp. AmelKG-E11A]|uniref:mycothiol transferase n=1 Tax=Streptomyces sp. SID4919 TaxID=2690270 RepID=UPI000823A8A1|nr:DUF664 domain-containing protein [Streptomyces sp. AmelKG-E11A]SCK11062.1 Protein of unknown function [Streptomyces sp. AmelKG-E11A]
MRSPERPQKRERRRPAGNCASTGRAVRGHTHVLSETVRHAGHADILREGLDGRTGLRAGNEQRIDEEARAAYCAKIEQAARTAASGRA